MRILTYTTFALLLVAAAFALIRPDCITVSSIDHATTYASEIQTVLTHNNITEPAHIASFSHRNGTPADDLLVFVHTPPRKNENILPRNMSRLLSIEPVGAAAQNLYLVDSYESIPNWYAHGPGIGGAILPFLALGSAVLYWRETVTEELS